MIKNKSIQALRMLGVDAITKANSGHPGIVLGAAPMMHTIYSDFLNIDARNSQWLNRDRFVLSAGHGSALLYAINHFAGYNISIEDIKNFRNFGNTPGHPEYGHTDGVETTSGPLGQGIANAVGMAMAESHLSAVFNEENFPVIDHYTYVLCGDGDLQEGVALEALSLAGHLKLNKLIILFDSNDIQLDGEVSLTYSENHKKKFEAMGFSYIRVEAGMDPDQIKKAIKKAKRSTDKPTFIEVKTEIGFGTDVAGTSQSHGKPLNQHQVSELKKALDWNYEAFEIPQDVYEYYRKTIILRGRRAFRKWQKMISAYALQHPNKYKQLNESFNQGETSLNALYELDFSEDEATRVSGGKVIQKASQLLPQLIGGSADLSSSTKAKGIDGDFTPTHRTGRNINFGVREHAMGAIINGMTLHGGLKVFGGAFFVFSDYMKPAIRLAAIMQIPSIFVMTHDSVAVGEDGPTHQPVEQLAGLRAIPNLNVYRPANGVETAAAFEFALTTKNTPSVIVLSRQNVDPTSGDREGALKGGYVISNEKASLDGVLLASGTEVGLALAAQNKLYQQGIDVRVVSMPSMYLFEQQNQVYQNQVLPKDIQILAIEAAHPMPWYKYTSNIIGIDQFGASADGQKVMEKYLMTSTHIVEVFKSL